MHRPAQSSRPAADAVRGPWQRYGWLITVVWLVFLYYPVRSLLESQAPWGAVALGWAALACFASAYTIGFVLGMRAGWRCPTPAVLRLFAVAIACALLMVPAIGWEAASLLPFLMSYASYGIGSTWHWIMIAVSFAIVAAASAVSVSSGVEPAWTLVGIVAMMAVVNTINTWLIDRSASADELRMELATSEERESIARDVHDLLGHSLTVVKLKAELASRLLDRDPAAARAELDEIVRLTGEAIAGVRGTVTGLRTTGVEEQLRASRAALESAGVGVEVAGDAASLSPAQSIAASWIMREATTNVLRHAGARRVRISIEPGTVVVEDDGAGLHGRPGNGLRGMAERAAAAGAVLRVGAAGAVGGEGSGARGADARAGSGARGADAREGSAGTRVELTW